MAPLHKSVIVAVSNDANTFNTLQKSPVHITTAPKLMDFSVDLAMPPFQTHYQQNTFTKFEFTLLVPYEYEILFHL